MCLSFLLAFACTVVRVLLLEGKCTASLQEDPAEDSLCLACFCCATTVQGLELDLRFCDGKLDCFFCWTASPYLTLDPFSSHERPRSSKKGGRRHISSDLYLFPGAGPLFQPWAAEILQKGAPQPDIKRAAIWFFSVPLPHIEAVPLSALSVPVLCACLLVRVAFFWQIPFPKHCWEWAFPSTPFTPGWPSSVGGANSPSP